MNYLRGNQTLENCYFPNKTDQQPKRLRIFPIFSEKLSLVVISWWVDSQTPSTLTFVFVVHNTAFSVVIKRFKPLNNGRAKTERNKRFLYKRQF